MFVRPYFGREAPVQQFYLHLVMPFCLVSIFQVQEQFRFPIAGVILASPYKHLVKFGIVLLFDVALGLECVI